MDYYDIDVEDRINLSSEVKLTQEQIDQLIADNVPGAGDLTQFRFFTNDFDTNTHGIDVVVSTYTEWLGGTTDWNLAYNNNRTEVEKFNPDTIGPGRIRQIEQTTPETRWNLSANHTVGNFRVLARLSFYDEWYDSFENDVFGTDAVFDSEYLSVKPLYEQLWHAQYPSLTFIGLQHSVVPFPFFELQAEAKP